MLKKKKKNGKGKETRSPKSLQLSCQDWERLCQVRLLNGVQNVGVHQKLQ